MQNELPFELLALQAADQYQSWVADTISPYLGQRALELGAGIGNMSVHLPSRELMVFSEEDQNLLITLNSRIRKRFGDSAEASKSIITMPYALGTPLSTQLSEFNFDTVVSFNVLEHIENDLAALKDMRELLQSSKSPGPKRVITVVPAHAWAYGTIDKSYGHFRRYDLHGFRKLAQKAGFSVDQPAHFYARYFNLIGLFGWFILNRVLKKKQLGMGSVQAFEKLCPLIRNFDDFLHHSLKIPFGQSLLCVLQLPEEQ